MTYVLVNLREETGSPMADVTYALKNAGLHVEYFETLTFDDLRRKAKDLHRDLTSLVEALDLIDQQQGEATDGV